MKKLLTISILVIMILAVATTLVSATTQSELEAYLTKTHTIAGKEVTLTAEQKVKVERYFSENTLTDEQATAIKAKVDEGIALMEEAGVSDPSQLSGSDKTALLNVAKEAAAEAGLTLTLNSNDNTIEIYKDGKLIESASTETGKFVQTGSNNLVFVALAVVAIIAVVATVVIKRARVNE